MLWYSMSNDLASDTTSLGTNAIRILGRVKWFNNKAGYGFITVTDGERAGSDIFVHHSGIKVANEQYRYLVQGEYVQFSLDHTPGAAHEFQASSISGINGGMLMCETRRDFRQSRTSYVEDDSEVVLAPVPSRRPDQSRPRARGTGPRESKEWSLVKNKAPKQKSV